MLTREQFIKKWENDCHYYFDGYYSSCVDCFLTEIYDDFEQQLKQAYINGSNSTNELIQSLYKQIEQLKDNA